MFASPILSSRTRARQLVVGVHSDVLDATLNMILNLHGRSIATGKERGACFDNDTHEALLR